MHGVIRVLARRWAQDPPKIAAEKSLVTDLLYEWSELGLFDKPSGEWSAEEYGLLVFLKEDIERLKAVTDNLPESERLRANLKLVEEKMSA